MNTRFLRRKGLVILAVLAVLFLAWSAWKYSGHAGRQSIASINVPDVNEEEPLQKYSDYDAGQIYQALIPAAARTSMLLLTMSVQPSACLLDDSDMPDAAFRDALHNFRRTNAAAWDVSSLIGGGQRITKAAHDSIFNRRDAATGKSGAGEGWNEFHRRYPRAKGILAVSTVGFDPGRTAAILYSEVSCGALCGTGSFTYFRRTPHGWDRVEAGIPNCGWIA